jgi:subtilase family serine protease
MKNMRSLPLRVLAATLFAAASVAIPTLAQQAAPQARIVAPIDEGQLVTLRGNVHPAAVAKNDRGPVSADFPMAGLTLVLSRSADQQAAFDAFVASQYDQGSPNFHQWLTPQQIGERFGPAQADVSTISGWLAGYGFAVKSVSADRMTINFSGTAGQVESAFHTSIHNLSVNGAAHIANMSDPQIPAALAPLVTGVKGLHNFFPHPLHRMGSKVQFNPDAHGWVKQQNAAGANPAAGTLSAQASNALVKPASGAKPNYYYPISGFTGVEEDVAPYDFAKIYNLPSGWPSTTSANGSGQTIVVIGTSDIDTTDVATFKSAFGLPAGTTPVIAHGPDGDPGMCSGGTNICNAGDLTENSLDVEWSGAVAPGAQIVLVTDAYNSQTDPTNDPLFDGAQWVVDNAYQQSTPVSGARIISLSYGQCELSNGTASNVAYNNLWQTAAAGGIAVFAASGDAGAPACDQDLDEEFGNPYEAQYGLAVSAEAATAYNTAVGGTDFSWCKPSYTISGENVNFEGCLSSNASTYWNTSNSSDQASAKGYVPEIPWNDTCLNPIWTSYFQSVAPIFDFSAPANSEAVCNFIYEDWQAVNQDNEEESDEQFVIAPWVDTVGGGGGASNCVVNTSTSTTLGSCSSGDASTGSTYDNLPLVNDGWPKPSWQTGVSGIPGDGVRDLPDISFFSGDGSLESATLICVSNDGAPCTDIANTASGGTGAAEEVGGTSVATPEMAGVMALINQKAGAAQGSPNAELYTLAAKQTYSSCSAETGTTSNGCYFNDIDQGTNSMPCDYEGKAVEGGTAFDGNTGLWEPTTASAGLASPNCSIVNSGDVVGTLSGYSAGTGYDQATGLGSLNIANVVSNWPAATTVTSTTAAISLSGVTSISTSQSLSVKVTVTGTGGTPTGTVTLMTSANDYIATQTLSAGIATFTIPANTFTCSGTVTLTAAYGGSSSFASSTTSSSVTITGSPCTSASTGSFSLGAISSPATIAPGGTATATATVSASGGYAGTVTLSCSLTTSPSGASNLPSCEPSGTITLGASSTSGSATLAVTTTPATTTDLRRPAGSGLLGAGGGAVLAVLVFFGIPARRRRWRAMLGMLAFLMALGGLSACGGGGGGGGGTTIPGTTAGTYTFTVTASGAPSSSTTPATQTFTVTVN